MSAVTTDHLTVTHIKSIIQFKLENPNLQANQTKTEEYETKHDIDNYKKYRSLGRLLDTDQDISG